MSAETTHARMTGPRAHESFFAAQQRNRRATWRLSALCVLATLVMGIPLALLLTPLLYALALILADIVQLFFPLPPALWQEAGEAARFGVVALNWLLNHQPADLQALAFGSAVLLLPGAVLSIVMWLGMNALLRHFGVGGALVVLKAREPNRADLKELQLVDVAEEMAIAAGLPAPRVMLIDAPGANAAAIGTSPADARIVLSRRLLDDLGRDELEGVLAHLVASVGNGDLRIAFRVTAVFETCGFLLAMINSPFGPQSRSTLWRILRYGVVGSRSEDAVRETAAVAAILARSVTLETDDIDQFFEPRAKKSALRSFRNFLLFPFFFTNAAIKLSLWFFSYALWGPSAALLWRTRRYLADASAVQLTRNPDGLASALEKLSADSSDVPGGEWASHLFILSPQRGSANSPNLQQKEFLAHAWASSAEPGATTPQPGKAGFPDIFKEVLTTYRAAAGGNAQALGRLRQARQNLAALDPALAAHIPDAADLLAARQGDLAAMARLQAFRGQLATQAPSETPAHKGTAPGAGLSSVSFLPFHPSLKRRLKRLERMGAHVDLSASQSKAWIIVLVLSLILAPLVLLLVVMFLLLIAILTMASLTFLLIWLAVIHKVFALVAHR